jgi:hypothetical protein
LEIGGREDGRVALLTVVGKHVFWLGGLTVYEDHPRAREAAAGRLDAGGKAHQLKIGLEEIGGQLYAVFGEDRRQLRLWIEHSRSDGRVKGRREEELHGYRTRVDWLRGG